MRTTRFPWTVAIVSLVICAGMSWRSWIVQGENQRLSFLNTIYNAEHRILKDEIAEYERKPNYEQGYKDALIRVGGPQNTGSYQDGWDDAMKLAIDNGYAEGYHAAIQQFGYQKVAANRWLTPEKVASEKKNDSGIPTKLDSKN